MPEYVPAPRLPEGLAAELGRMAQSNAQIIPGALQNMVQQLSQAYQQQQDRQRTTLSLPQAQAMGFNPMVPAPGPAAPGSVAPQQSMDPNQLKQLFPRGITQDQLKLFQEDQNRRATIENTNAFHQATVGLGKEKADTAKTKAEGEMAKTHTAATPEILAALDKKKMNIGFKVGDYIPNTIIAAASGADAKKEAAAAKAGSGDEKLWEGLNRAVNPANAPRGSLLGQAGQGNARADRALTTLASKNITPQQVSAVVADYAGIMQGGAPHEIALRQMGYDNLATRWANMQQFITSNPQAVNTPQVVGQLRQMVSEIKQVDNEIIKNNLDTVEQTHSGLLQKDQARWGKIRDSVMKTTGEKQTPDGRITVKDKNGNIGHIPKEQLKEAISEGYSEVKE